MSRKILNASEMGRLGGNKHKETKPPEYWKELGKKGNEAMKKLGDDFYKERARKIVESRNRNKKNKQKSIMDKMVDVLNGG